MAASPTAATRGPRVFRHVATVPAPLGLQPQSPRPPASSHQLFVPQDPAAVFASSGLQQPSLRPPDSSFVTPHPARCLRAPGTQPRSLLSPQDPATAPEHPHPPTLQPSSPSPLSGRSRLRSRSPRLPQAVTSAPPGIQLSCRWPQVQQPRRAARPECGPASAGR